MLLWIPSLSSPFIHYRTPPQMPSDLHVSTSSWFTPSNVVFHSPPLHWNWKKSVHKLKSLWQVILLTAVTMMWPAPSLPVFGIPLSRLSSHHLPDFPWLLTLLSLYGLPWESHQLSQHQLWESDLSAEGQRSIPPPLSSHDVLLLFQK